MQHGDPGAGEPPLDARHGLPSQADLGHEQQDRAAGLERRLRRLEVHLGLAAPRDAVQKDLVAGLGLAEDRVERAPLLREQVRHVREGRARAQPRRLGRGGRRDAVGRRLLGSLVRDGLRRCVSFASRVLDDDGARLDQPAKPLRGEAAGRAQLAFLEYTGLLKKAERRALASSEPRGRRRTAAQRPPRRRDADDVHPVRDAQPALAPVALGGRRETARLEPQAGEFVQPALAGLRGCAPGRGELVLAYDLERARGRTDERERVGERREVVLLDAPCDGQQVRGDRGHVQHVAQGQDAALVRGDVAKLEDHTDDGLGAERHGDERTCSDTRGELGGDLVVEGTGEGPGADEREDGGVGHSAPPSPRRGRVSP